MTAETVSTVNTGEIQAQELMDRNLFSDSMLDNVLGPVAFYKLRGEELDVVRYNRKFLDEIRIPSFSEYINSIQRLVYQNDLPLLYELFRQAKADPQAGAIGVIRFRRLDGSSIQCRFHLYYVRDEADGSGLYYSSVQNLAQFLTVDDYTRLLSQAFDGTVIFLRRRGMTWSFRVVVHGLEKEMGLNADELQFELNDGRFKQRASSETVVQIKQIILGAPAQTAYFSRPFDLETANGGTLRLQMRLYRVQDKSSEVDYVLSFNQVE